MSKKKQPAAPYFKVVALENENTAEVLLYGVIGQDYWWDEDLNEESITDLAVAKKLAELDAKYDRINIRINSPGGSVFHGDAIIAAMKRCSATISTYNDGLAASMAADIWMQGQNRYAAVNSKFMIHATSTIAWGNAKEMERTAEMLRKMDEASIASMAEATEKSEEDIFKTFYEDYEDHWLTRKDMDEMGMITGEEAYESQVGMDNDMERLSYGQLMDKFRQDPPLEQSFINKMKKRWQEWQRELMPSNSKLNNDTIMNREELQRSLEEGKDLTAKEVAEVLRSHGYEVQEPKPANEDTPDVAQLIKSAVEEIVNPMQETINELTKTVQQIGDAPGTEPATIPRKSDPANEDISGLSDEQKSLKAKMHRLNQDFQKAFQSGDRIRLTPPGVSKG